jgi:hypothetical protein
MDGGLTQIEDLPCKVRTEVSSIADDITITPQILKYIYAVKIKIVEVKCSEERTKYQYNLQ